MTETRRSRGKRHEHEDLDELRRREAETRDPIEKLDLRKQIELVVTWQGGQIESERLNQLALSLIRDAMKQHGITQTQVADRLGVHRSLITNIFSRSSSGHSLTLRVLAEVMYTLGYRVRLVAEPLNNDE